MEGTRGVPSPGTPLTHPACTYPVTRTSVLQGGAEGGPPAREGLHRPSQTRLTARLVRSRYMTRLDFVSTRHITGLVY